MPSIRSWRPSVVLLAVVALPLLAPAASAYIGPGGTPSPSPAELVAVALGALALAAGAVAAIAALLGPAWIAWYSWSLAPRRRAMRIALVVGSSFPDALAGSGRRAKLP